MPQVERKHLLPGWGSFLWKNRQIPSFPRSITFIGSKGNLSWARHQHFPAWLIVSPLKLQYHATHQNRHQQRIFVRTITFIGLNCDIRGVSQRERFSNLKMVNHPSDAEFQPKLLSNCNSWSLDLLPLKNDTLTPLGLGKLPWIKDFCPRSITYMGSTPKFSDRQTRRFSSQTAIVPKNRKSASTGCFSLKLWHFWCELPKKQQTTPWQKFAEIPPLRKSKNFWGGLS